MDINLPNGVNIISASSQFIINNITKPPKIPFTPLLIPHVLSSSLKKEIVERFANIPVKNKTIRKICFFTNNSKKEQNEIRPIKLFIKCAKLK